MMEKDIIQYRRQRATETIGEAELLLDNQKLYAAVNRIYYAVFYEVVALLLTKSLSSAKHTGVRSLFNKEFIKKGIVDKKQGEFYNSIFGFRTRADYEDFIEFDSEKVKSWLNNAKEFIDSIDRIIQTLLNESKKYN
ncbi:MAG: HEPN domain-containing protein [Actinobacteria bacterium]|nr:HEPN domain-containing protein [Actinomycetota bacterium]MCG2788604.1 HEPN domain-containing protein [Actinomycetes bacterium]